MKRTSTTIVIFCANIVMEVTFLIGVISGQTFMNLFHMSKENLGIFFGVANIGWLIASPVAGRLVHRWGGFPVAMGSILASLVGVVLLAGATGYPMLLAGGILTGITLCFLAIANATMLADMYPKNLRRIASLAAATWFGSTAVMAPLIGKWLNVAEKIGAEMWGFRAAYAAAFVGLLLVFAAVWIVVGARHRAVRALPVPDPSSTPDPRAPSRASRLWLWIPVLATLHGIVLITLQGWSTKMMQDKFLLPEQSAALVLSASAMGLAVGRVLLAIVRLHVDDRTILAVGSLGGALLVTWGLASRDATLTMVAIGAGAFVSCATHPCLTAIVGTRFAAAKAKLYGFMSAGLALGGLIGPPTVGALAERGVPLHRALLISPAAAVLLAVLALVWRVTDTRPTFLDESRSSVVVPPA